MLPDELEQLNAVVGSEHDILCFHDRREDQYLDWLYFGDDYIDHEPHEFIVVAAPLPYINQRFRPSNEGIRVAAYLDGHINYLPEADFRAAIKQQREQAVAPTPPSLPAP